MCTCLCSDAEEATHCIGKVQYFLKLHLRNDQSARDVAAKLGVDFKFPIRLAMCKAWRVDDRGFKASKEFKNHKKFKDLAETLHAAGLTKGANRRQKHEAALDIIKDMEESATLWRALKGSRICLKGSQGWADGIDLLPVPISSVHEGTTWSVDPMVVMDPTKAKVVLTGKTRSPAGMQAAITQLQKTFSFFTGSHATSQQGSWVA
jgi:hypothetical protein